MKHILADMLIMAILGFYMICAFVGVAYILHVALKIGGGYENAKSLRCRKVF